MNKFDSIRPYEDSEVEEVLSSLCSNANVISALIDSFDSSLISLLPFKEKIISFYLKRKTKNINSRNMMNEKMHNFVTPNYLNSNNQAINTFHNKPIIYDKNSSKNDF